MDGDGPVPVVGTVELATERVDREVTGQRSTRALRPEELKFAI
jgi:hypothetical protein